MAKSHLMDVLDMFVDLMLYILCAVSDVQIGFVIANCTLFTIFKVF
jgi:hypothetical protein